MSGFDCKSLRFDRCVWCTNWKSDEGIGVERFSDRQASKKARNEDHVCKEHQNDFAVSMNKLKVRLFISGYSEFCKVSRRFKGHKR